MASSPPSHLCQFSAKSLQDNSTWPTQWGNSSWVIRGRAGRASGWARASHFHTLCHNHPKLRTEETWGNGSRWCENWTTLATATSPSSAAIPGFFGPKLHSNGDGGQGGKNGKPPLLCTLPTYSLTQLFFWLPAANCPHCELAMWSWPVVTWQ